MWRRLDIVWTDVSEERITSVFRVEKSASEEPAWAVGCSSSVLFGVHVVTEDGGDIFLRKVCWLSPDLHGIISQKINSSHIIIFINLVRNVSRTVLEKNGLLYDSEWSRWHQLCSCPLRHCFTQTHNGLIRNPTECFARDWVSLQVITFTTPDVADVVIHC
jgi:hypothetical protein